MTRNKKIQIKNNEKNNIGQNFEFFFKNKKIFLIAMVEYLKKI
jgi:hypothetical protein